MKKIHIDYARLIVALGSNVIKTEGPVENVYIDNLSDVQNTTETTLDWVNPTKQNKQQNVENTKAKVVLVDNEVEYSSVIKELGKTLIYVNNPKIAIAIIGNEFFVKKEKPTIHPTAVIDPAAKIGENVTIGPNVVIGDAVIGDGSYISSNVRIYDNVSIGKHCFIKEGAIIGGAGFGFEIDEDGNRFRFPQLGGVIIGDHVEIGGNTCIDRGALSDTVIDSYAKIDNLCHIAHNAHIGKNSMIIACSEISGSCSIGENSWIGPNTSIRDWLNVGNDSLIGMGSVVVKDIPSNEVWAGNPAKPFKK